MSALVSDEDYEAVAAFKWYYVRRENRGCGYAQRSLRIGGIGLTQSMHKFVANRMGIGGKNTESAARVYNRWAVAIHREFAYTNFGDK